jgi:hypothetical protein
MAVQQRMKSISQDLNACVGSRSDFVKKLCANKQAFKGKQAIPLPLSSIKSKTCEEQSEVFWAQGGSFCAQGVVFCDVKEGIFVRQGGVSCAAR